MKRPDTPGIRWATCAHCGRGRVAVFDPKADGGRGYRLRQHTDAGVLCPGSGERIIGLPRLAGYGPKR